MSTQLHPAHDVLVDPCPRCDSNVVRAVVYGPLDIGVEIDADVSPVAPAFADEAPFFDCRECGFEWGVAVRDLLA